MVLHLTFLHFSFQYLEQRQVIRTHIGYSANHVYCRRPGPGHMLN